MPRVKKVNCDHVLRDLLETAKDFSAYGLASKADIARLKVLCGESPADSADRVVTIRTKTVKSR